LIAEKFSSGNLPVNADTIFDSGGPTFDYYNNEDYLYTITVAEEHSIFLSFSYLILEEGYDSLWIYDGSDSLSPVTGIFTGDTIPTLITSSGNSLTLRFKSDIAYTGAGWRAVYDTLPVSQVALHTGRRELFIYPNPAMDRVTIDNQGYKTGTLYSIRVFDSRGKRIYQSEVKMAEQSLILNTAGWSPGSYFVVITDETGFKKWGKFLKVN
jgi:hypothetical protein